LKIGFLRRQLVASFCAYIKAKNVRTTARETTCHIAAHFAQTDHCDIHAHFLVGFAPPNTMRIKRKAGAFIGITPTTEALCRLFFDLY
jgi:hypothetical protein